MCVCVCVPLFAQAFRTNLVGLTEVTRNYFVKLVRQLEKGFDNLANDYAGQ